MGHSSLNLTAIAKAVGGVAAVTFGGYGLLSEWLSFSGAVPYAELDLNPDGRVNFGEAEYDASYGERTIAEGKRQCAAHFAYNDGLTLNVICPRHT